MEIEQLLESLLGNVIVNEPEDKVDLYPRSPHGSLSSSSPQSPGGPMSPLSLTLPLSPVTPTLPLSPLTPTLPLSPVSPNSYRYPGKAILFLKSFMRVRLTMYVMWGQWIRGVDILVV